MEGISQEIVERLTAASIGGGIAVLAALLLTWRFRKLPPVVLNWIWRLALLKIVAGLFWLSPVELHLFRPTTITNNPQMICTDPIPGSVAPPPEAEPAPAPASPPKFIPTRPRIDPAIYWAGTWLLGATAAAAVYTIRSRRAIKFVADCQPVSDATAIATLAASASSLGLRRIPELRSTELAISPVLIGLWRPVIVVPENLISKDCAEALHIALLHELCHEKRMDPWWTALDAISHCVLFFHPLLWISNRPWNFAQEAACDAMTLQQSGVPADRYSDALLELMRLTNSRSTLGLAVVPIESQKQLFSRRLEWIENWRPLPRRVKGTLLVGLCLLGVAGVVPWRIPQAGAVGFYDDHRAWPRPIGDVDWSTPTLASPAASNGFKILGIQRIRSYGAGRFGDLSINGPYLDPFTTAVWIQIPEWATDPPYRQFGHQSHIFTAKLVTRAGACVLQKWTTTLSNSYCVVLPVGYPAWVKEADLNLEMGGKSAASWHFTGMPRSPRLMEGQPNWVAEQSAVGVKFGAYVKHLSWSDGRNDVLAWSVYNKTALPTDRLWDLETYEPTMERVSNSVLGSGMGRLSLNYISPEGKRIDFVGPGAETENRHAFAETLTTAVVRANLIGFQSHESILVLKNFTLRSEETGSRSFHDMRTFLTVGEKDVFDTPEGVPIRICVTQSPQAGLSTVDPGMSFGLGRAFLPEELPRSRLARYGRPIAVAVGIKGLKSLAGNCAFVDGRIELFIDTAMTRLPDQVELIFTEKVDLEKHPMDFLVPIEGPDSHQHKP